MLKRGKIGLMKIMKTVKVKELGGGNEPSWETQSKACEQKSFKNKSQIQSDKYL